MTEAQAVWRDNMPQPWRIATRSGRVYAVAPEFPPQGLAVDSEVRGRKALVASRFMEDPLDVSPFGLGERCGFSGAFSRVAA